MGLIARIKRLWEMSEPINKSNYIQALEEHIEMLESHLEERENKIDLISKHFDVYKCVERFLERFEDLAMRNYKEKILDECIRLVSHCDFNKISGGGDFGKQSRIVLNDDAVEIDFHDTCFSIVTKKPRWHSEVISVVDVDEKKYHTFLRMVQTLGRCYKNKKYNEFIDLLSDAGK